jgi:leucyl-tRNA synthetase
MWSLLGHKPGVALAGWPALDESLLGVDNVEAVLQINGKIKDRVTVAPSITDAELEKMAMENAEIKAALAGATPKKVIAKAPKFVNIVL